MVTRTDKRTGGDGHAHGLTATDKQIATLATQAQIDAAITAHETRFHKTVQPPPIVNIPIDAVFVSTTGSDANDGSQTNPWATLSKAIAMGRKIVMRGGNYGAGNYNQYVNGVSDVTIMAYPGEKVTIDGGADGVSINDRHFIIGSGVGCRNWLIQDLTLVRFCKLQNGIITISAQSGMASNWHVLRCDIEKVNPGGPSFQVVYGGANMDTLIVEDCIIRGHWVLGLEDGAGVGTDHTPSTRNLIVKNTQFVNLHKGVQTYGGDGDPNGPSGSVDSCTFTGCGRNIELQHHGTFSVTNNKGSIAKEGASQNLIIAAPTNLVTVSGNVWS
jgi:hypothetical protein